MNIRFLAGLLAVAVLLAADSGAAQEGIYRLKSGRLITQDDFEFRKLQSEVQGIAFSAVRTNRWPSGMVPIFQLERTNRFELRRRPARGQENFTEPLFFALPPEDEPEAVKLAGHWEGIAGRGGGGKDYPAFEFAIEGTQVVGRFDQNTEYRYAYVSGGTFQSNQLELRIDYLNESWLLNATWSPDKLKGTWRRADDAEHGSWEATRNPAVLPKGEAVPLYEWRHVADSALHYDFDSPGPEWKRAPRPLCRTWRATAPNLSR